MSNESSVGMMRSWGSQNWMAASLAPNDVVIKVQGSSRTYSGKDIGDIYHMVGQPNLEVAYHHNLQSTAVIAPGVEAYIIAGSGVMTPQDYTFGPSRTDPTKPDITAGAVNVTCVTGDQVATLDALIGVAERWRAQGVQQGKPVHTQALPGASHANTVASGAGLATLYTAILNAK